jgi:hypothetical protein
LKWTNCTPDYTTENTIATRGDLNPKVRARTAVVHVTNFSFSFQDGVWALPNFAQRNHVATDSKITARSMFHDVDHLNIIAQG